MLATLANAPLIATIAVSLSAALLTGVVARKLRLSPIVGYMLAGIVVGPHTPGFVADQQLAEQLAEIGIALLMFGVGLHFSLDDLLAVRRVAVPGALGQSAIATAFGVLIGLANGWGLGGGLVFGLALSVASTVVLVRGLTDQQQLHSLHGHVAIGWLVVEDLFTVLILVALPALAGDAGADGAGLLARLGWTLLEVLGLGLLYVLGVRVVPWFLLLVAKLQSRELFTLAVLAVALGIAYGSAVLFGVSMALGAFLGGMIVGRSELSHQAAADALPLRDAFAVLFFVSVGMLFEPGFALAHPLLVAATLAVVVLVKPLSALVITLLCGHPVRTGVTVAAGLAQIGEFSFILGGLGRGLGLLPPTAYQAIVAAALLSIALNPLCFALAAPLEAWLRRRRALERWLADRPGPLARVDPAAAELHDHAVLIGHGRTGKLIARVVRERGWPLLVVEQDRAEAIALRQASVPVLHGDGANEFVLERAQLSTARILLITLADPLATRQIAEHARRLAPDLEIVARIAHASEREHLDRLGRVETVTAESELAIEMARHALLRFGLGPLEAQAAALDLRHGIFTAREGARVLEVAIGATSPGAGRRLADLALGKGVLAMAIERDGAMLIPDGATQLLPGDRVLLVCGPEQAAQVRDKL